VGGRGGGARRARGVYPPSRLGYLLGYALVSG